MRGFPLRLSVALALSAPLCFQFPYRNISSRTSSLSLHRPDYPTDYLSTATGLSLEHRPLIFDTAYQHVLHPQRPLNTWQQHLALHTMFVSSNGLTSHWVTNRK